MYLKDVASQDVIEFKGNKTGLIVNIKKQLPLEQIKENLISKLETCVGFFNGAKISKINSDYLTDIDILQLKEVITSRFDVKFTEDEVKNETNTMGTKYVKSIRSGENIEYEGNVIVLCDMKPGSEVISTNDVVVMGNVQTGAKIIAGGNITVMGTILGFVHAGSNGNRSSFVVSKKLRLKVIKIADLIAEAPEDDDYVEDKKENNSEIANIKENNSEIAHIVDDNIIIEIKTL
ncbi:MAG: septum site-determining protein MinC [Clostridioides sp.]|jgi:septum site-determining protein MinC|nr:septum site-determining protein MinC [Clostridioides sp.]